MAKQKPSEDAGAAPAPLSHEEIGAKYFAENENCPVDSIIVTDDGIVFYDTLKGQNSAANYCAGAGVGSKTISR